MSYKHWSRSDMSILRPIKVRIYKTIRIYRCNVIKRQLDTACKTMLDIGCQELYFYDQLKKDYDITLADYMPKLDVIKQEDVQNLSFEDNSFDIALCQQVLEHVPDPVAAIKELKRVAKKQLIITVPYEPFFTLARFLTWEKEHLWAVTPAVLKHYLGPPVYENKIFFKRYYVGVWKFE